VYPDTGQIISLQVQNKQGSMHESGWASHHPIYHSSADKPLLAILIDTEEEFDWSQPFSRDNVSVRHMREIERCQHVFEKFGIVPTYMVDYPIASQREAYAPLVELVHLGKATVGAHLHPWVNPPYVEEVCSYNSYPGNLPKDIELEKLRILRDQISEWAGENPRIYRAGRYGVGPNSYEVLKELGFEVDSSPSPGFDLTRDGGPDFRFHTHLPYWIDTPGSILCVPVAGGMVGPLPKSAKIWVDQLLRVSGGFVPAEGILSRLHLFSRIRLTPEGYTLAEMVQLTRYLISRGIRMLVLGFHSPSLSPGNTPYARNVGERDLFLERLEEYLSFFVSELGGKPTTLAEFRSSLIHGT
jgi:hypothetical protein